MSEISQVIFQKGTKDLIRDINTGLIVHTVKLLGPISRADISRHTGLSPATVTNITARLIRTGIIYETTTAKSVAGRRPVLLSLNPSGGYVIGVKLKEDGIMAVITNLDAEVINSKEITAQIKGKPSHAIQSIEQVIKALLNESSIDKKKILGVGIGLAGIVDSVRGVCTYSHRLDWYNVPLQDPLRRRLKMPVWIENDVNTLAVAEKWFGAAINCKDFLTLSIGRGIGLGIVIDRKLYRGARGGAGEFGHITVDPYGPKCQCGKSGCLETYAGEEALKREARLKLGRDINVDELVELANQGNLTARTILETAGRILGKSLANLVTLIDPELLVVSGEGTRLGNAFLNPMIEEVKNSTFGDVGKDLPIVVQPWGDEAWAVGAATIVLRELFNIPGEQVQENGLKERLSRWE